MTSKLYRIEEKQKKAAQAHQSKTHEVINYLQLQEPNN